MDRRTRAVFNEVFNQKVPTEVIIMGGSDALCSIDPGKIDTDKVIYNFSIDGAAPTYNEQLYSNYIREFYGKPSYLIYGITPTSIDTLGRRLHHDSRFIGYRATDFYGVLGGLSRLHILHVRSILEKVLAAARRYINLTPDGNSLGQNIKKFNNGFMPCFVEGGYSASSETMLSPINKSEKDAISNLISQAKKDGIKVSFLALPTPEGLYNKGDIEDFYLQISKLSDELNVTLLRADFLSKDFNRNTQNFYDKVHFSEKGAFRFAKDLGELLKEQLFNN